jgi:hypothetical protein
MIKLRQRFASKVTYSRLESEDDETPPLLDKIARKSVPKLQSKTRKLELYIYIYTYTYTIYNAFPINIFSIIYRQQNFVLVFS